MRATITVEDKDKHIWTVFQAELKDIINNRASYTVDNKEGETTFIVEANDFTALRATLNAITKQLVVFEQMQNIQ